MAAAATCSSLHLLVILLGFSYLICLNAVPISRSRSLLDHEAQTKNLLDSEKRHQEIIAEEILEQEEFIHGRMDLGSSDYPGSGPNNRHTPKPPLL